MIGQHKRKFFYALVLVAFTFLVVGARHVIHASRSRTRASERTQQRLQEWHTIVGNELPAGQQLRWELRAKQDPEQLLRGCAVETQNENE